MSFSTPIRSRGANRSKEDVDKFVDRIQETEVFPSKSVFDREGGWGGYNNAPNMKFEFIINF